MALLGIVRQRKPRIRLSIYVGMALQRLALRRAAWFCPERQGFVNQFTPAWQG